jgi:hypothetical protein
VVSHQCFGAVPVDPATTEGPRVPRPPGLPGGPRHAGFEATTKIRRKDFGIDIALPPGLNVVPLGDVVMIDIDLQLLEPES